MSKKKRERVLSEFFAKPCPYELDVIDRGDHLKVTSCNPEVAGWWVGTLKSLYPQDHISGDGDTLKMHPKAGVTLKLTKGDGTLRIKGKKHIDWFQENFDSILDAGAKELAAVNEMAKQCDQHLKLQDSFTVRDLLNSLPASGAFKHGPSYIYRLWRGLLDQWIASGGDVYVVTPLLDAKRLSDILLMLVKHKLSGSRVHLMCLNRCDADAKFPKVLKDAKELLRDIKGPHKKRLVQEERLKMAEQRLDVRFGRFHCKLIAMCHDGNAEIMVTSASYHKWHYEMENGDTLAHFKLRTEELVNNYLAPLGLAHQVLLDNGKDLSMVSAPSDRSLASTMTNSLSPTSLQSPMSSLPPGSDPSSPTTPPTVNNGTATRSVSMRCSSLSPAPPGHNLAPTSPRSRSVPSVAVPVLSAPTTDVRLSNPTVNINNHSGSMTNSIALTPPPPPSPLQQHQQQQQQQQLQNHHHLQQQQQQQLQQQHEQQQLQQQQQFQQEQQQLHQQQFQQQHEQQQLQQKQFQQEHENQQLQQKQFQQEHEHQQQQQKQFQQEHEHQQLQQKQFQQEHEHQQKQQFQQQQQQQLQQQHKQEQEQLNNTQNINIEIEHQVIHVSETQKEVQEIEHEMISYMQNNTDNHNDMQNHRDSSHTASPTTD